MLNAERKMKLLIAFFSYTGKTKQVAEALSERLRKSCEIQITEIVPRRKRLYLHWLAYSFVPGSEVEIDNPPLDVSGYDAVMLGFPKWTFSCPPLNRFIHMLNGFAKAEFFLFMTCGGFDEDRFLRSFTHTLKRMGCNVVGSVKLSRRQISEGDYLVAIDVFARRIEEHLLLRTVR